MTDGYVWIHSDTCGAWGRNFDPEIFGMFDLNQFISNISLIIYYR